MQSLYNTVLNSMVEKFGSQNINMLHPNPCYNDACYKGITTVLVFEMPMLKIEGTAFQVPREILKTEDTACWVLREIMKTEGIACQFPREMLKTEGTACQVLG